MKNDAKSEKTSIHCLWKRFGIWIYLIIPVSIWMFILGVLVGRGTAPVKFDINGLQKELALLKERAVKRELSQIKVDPDTEHKKTDLGFYEALRENGDKGRRFAGKIMQKKSGATEKDSPWKKKTSLKKETISANADKKSASSEQGKKRSIQKDYTIQVASLKNSIDADKMVTSLKKKGYLAYKTIREIPGKGIWYRIRIGYYKDGKEAKSILTRLKNENIEAFLIKR